MPDRIRIIATPECLPDSAVARLQEIADRHPDAEIEVAGGLATEGYDPACLSVLAGMETPRRPAGFVEDECRPVVSNPEGLDDFDPIEDPAFRASVQAYSDRLRDRRGRPRIVLGAPADVPGGVPEAPGEPIE